MKILKVDRWALSLSLCMSAVMYTPRLHKAMIENYGKITVYTE